MLKEQGHEIHVAAKYNLNVKPGLVLDNVDKVFDIPFSRSPFSTDNIKAYKELKRQKSLNCKEVALKRKRISLKQS